LPVPTSPALRQFERWCTSFYDATFPTRSAASYAHANVSAPRILAVVTHRPSGRGSDRRRVGDGSPTFSTRGDSLSLDLLRHLLDGLWWRHGNPNNLHPRGA
jgi:hypothetical protein